MHIGENIVKFTANDRGIYISKPDRKCSRKVSEEKEEDDLRIKKFAHRWVKQEWFYQTSV